MMLPPEPGMWYGLYLIIYGTTVRIIMIVAAVQIQSNAANPVICMTVFPPDPEFGSECT